MSERYLDEHIKNEYRRSTELEPGTNSAYDLVTDMADHIVRLTKLAEDAALAGTLVFLKGGLDEFAYVGDDELRHIRDAIDATYEEFEESLKGAPNETR